MEEKKNNAIEKVENLTDDNKAKRTKKSAYKPENDQNEDLKTQNGKDLKKKDKALRKKENETETEKKRTILAEKKHEEKERKRALKAKRKAEKEKAKKAKRAVLKKKKEEYKAEKLRRKEERLARRDMLKHESKEEREKRLAAEKQAKLNQKAQARQDRMTLREEKASLKRQKLADKRALKEQKRQLKMQNKREKRSRGLGGWLAAVIALGSSTLILATLFTLSMLNMFDTVPMSGDNAVAESYYSLIDYVDNMNVTMSKLMVSNDSAQQQRLLVDLSTQANLAAEDISRIPLKDESKYYTTKYINQVADYSKYLNNRLIDGDLLSDKDRENLNSLYGINGVLKEELSKLNMEMGSEFDFKTIFNENEDNVFLDKFNELEKRAVDYPKLIYDGPFSDALDKKEDKDGEKITPVEAQEKFEAAFSKFDIKNVEITGETRGKIDCYAIKADTKDGEIYATVSQKDGKLEMFNNYKDCSAKNYGLEECISKGEEFLKEIGLDDMVAVWATENGATAYINYCYNQGGVIIYNDMIKVTVCKERGIVSAFDATAYNLNHKKRSLSEPKITQKQAITGLSTDLSVLATRLCFIPHGENKEVLAYEVFGRRNNSTYYVYVDAETGREVQIFCVVETLEGDLLM